MIFELLNDKLKHLQRLADGDTIKLQLCVSLRVFPKAESSAERPLCKVRGGNLAGGYFRRSDFVKRHVVRGADRLIEVVAKLRPVPLVGIQRVVGGRGPRSKVGICGVKRIVRAFRVLCFVGCERMVGLERVLRLGCHRGAARTVGISRLRF